MLTPLWSVTLATFVLIGSAMCCDDRDAENFGELGPGSGVECIYAGQPLVSLLSDSLWLLSQRADNNSSSCLAHPKVALRGKRRTTTREPTRAWIKITSAPGAAAPT